MRLLGQSHVLGSSKVHKRWVREPFTELFILPMAATPLFAVPSLDNSYGSIFIGMVAAAGFVIITAFQALRLIKYRLWGIGTAQAYWYVVYDDWTDKVWAWALEIGILRHIQRIVWISNSWWGFHMWIYSFHHTNVGQVSVVWYIDMCIYVSWSHKFMPHL